MADPPSTASSKFPPDSISTSAKADTQPICVISDVVGTPIFPMDGVSQQPEAKNSAPKKLTPLLPRPKPQVMNVVFVPHSAAAGVVAPLQVGETGRVAQGRQAKSLQQGVVAPLQVCQPGRVAHRRQAKSQKQGVVNLVPVAGLPLHLVPVSAVPHGTMSQAKNKSYTMSASKHVEVNHLEQIPSSFHKVNELHPMSSSHHKVNQLGLMSSSHHKVNQLDRPMSSSHNNVKQLYPISKSQYEINQLDQADKLIEQLKSFSKVKESFKCFKLLGSGLFLRVMELF